MEKRRVLVVLVFLAAIFFLGFFLRLHDLDKESFWVDEIITLRHAQEETLQGLLSRVSLREGAPPGHYFFLQYWIRAFGDSAFSTRFPSVLFGTFSILLLFFIVGRIFGAKIALLSSVFLATSMLQVLYSQETRLYALFTFISLMTLYFFLRTFYAEKEWSKVVRGKGVSGKLVERGAESRQIVVNIAWKTVGWYGLYFLSVLIAFYTNYLTIFLVVGYTLVLLWRWEETKFFFSRWMFLHAFLAIFLIPLLPLVSSQLISIGNNVELTFMSFGVPPLLAKIGLLLFAFPLLLITAFLCLALVYRRKISTFLKSFFQSKSFPWFFLSFVVLFSGMYLYLSHFPLALFGIPLFRVPITQSYFLIRHSFFLAPLFSVFFAYAFWKVPRKIAAVALCVLVLSNGFALSFYYQETTKPQWREAVAFMEKSSPPGQEQLLLLDRGGSTNMYLLEYYLKIPFRVLKLTKASRGKPLWKITPEELFAELETEERFWLVLAGNRETEEYYKELLETKYLLRESHEFKEIKVYLFSR